MIGLVRQSIAGMEGVFERGRRGKRRGFWGGGGLGAAIGIEAEAVIVPILIDRRRATSDPAGWAALSSRTSVVPFAAIVSGRQRLDLREIGTWRVALGLAAWAVVLATHRLVIGVSPYTF